ncbi:MAG: hypothetical protein WBN65_03320, partial [Gammaproteobacteria bacterium]
DSPLAALEIDAAMDGLLTAGSSADFGDVYVGGKRQVSGHRHRIEDTLARAYAGAMRSRVAQEGG